MSQPACNRVNVVQNRFQSNSGVPSRQKSRAAANAPPMTAKMIVAGLPAHPDFCNLFYDRADTAETVNFRSSFLVLAIRSKGKAGAVGECLRRRTRCRQPQQYRSVRDRTGDAF